MNIASHLGKICKLESLRERLDPAQDFELWFWASMTAGTHAVNAVLHHERATLADDVFPTQPGVYLVAQPDGSLKPQFHPLGDVLHVGRPPVKAPVSKPLERMMHLMEVIEEHRDPCIRGDRVPTPDIAKECNDALRECLYIMGAQLGRKA